MWAFEMMTSRCEGSESGVKEMETSAERRIWRVKGRFGGAICSLQACASSTVSTCTYKRGANERTLGSMVKMSSTRSVDKRRSRSSIRGGAV